MNLLYFATALVWIASGVVFLHYRARSAKEAQSAQTQQRQGGDPR